MYIAPLYKEPKKKSIFFLRKWFLLPFLFLLLILSFEYVLYFEEFAKKIPVQTFSIITPEERFQTIALQECAPYWHSFYLSTTMPEDLEVCGQSELNEFFILMCYIHTALTPAERNNPSGVSYYRIQALAQQAIVATFGRGYALYSVDPYKTITRLDSYKPPTRLQNLEKRISIYIKRVKKYFIKSDLRIIFQTMPEDQVAVQNIIDGQYIPPEKIGLALYIIRNNLDYSQLSLYSNPNNETITIENCWLFPKKDKDIYYLYYYDMPIVKNRDIVIFTAQSVVTLSNAIDMITPEVLQIKRIQTVKEAQNTLQKVKYWQIIAKSLTFIGQFLGVPTFSLYEAMGHEHENFLGYNPKIKEERLRKEQIMELLEDKNLIFD